MGGAIIEEVVLGRGFTWEVKEMVEQGKGKIEREGRQGLLPFEYEEQGREARVTAYGGLPVVVEMMRALRVDKSVGRHVHTRETKPQGAFTDTQLVEGAVLMLAAGGECCDDIEVVRADGALEEMLGHSFPSAAVLKQFLYRFHDDSRDEAVGRMRAQTPSYVPEENEPLRGLSEVTKELVGAVQKRSLECVATLDIDATIIESDKVQAAKTYEGTRGYQPMTVIWAEQDQVVADEFRDGNVPAQAGVLSVLKRAVEALPAGVQQLYVRSDSAAYQHDVMDWCDEDIEDRPPITFAISADMTAQLRAAVQSLAQEMWYLVDPEDPCREWAELPYVPSNPYEQKQSKPYRYLAIRITPRQRELFLDGSSVKHFAVVTNDWKRDGAQILQWHRGKAGTIEHLHHVLHNELGAGVVPCARFGANAAWYRLNVLTYNVLSALRRLVLPKELKKARPKRLRFHLFCVAAELIHHARTLIVRLARRWLVKLLVELTLVRRRILSLAQP
jgi:hypothetical protein